MKIIGLFLLGCVALAVLRLGLQMLAIVAGMAFLLALYRDPGRVFAASISCVLLLAVMSLPPVTKLLVLIALLFTNH